MRSNRIIRPNSVGWDEINLAQSLWHPAKITCWRKKQLPHDTENTCKSIFLKYHNSNCPKRALENECMLAFVRYVPMDTISGPQPPQRVTTTAHLQSNTSPHSAFVYSMFPVTISHVVFGGGRWGIGRKGAGRLWSGSACKSEVGVSVLW